MRTPPLIILEGPDCVGKTTLGKEISKEFGGMYFHATASKTLFPAMQAYQTSILDNVETNIAMYRACVLDRHWPSEIVYGNVYRKETANGFNPEPHIERIRALHGIYIMCDRVDVVERHAEKKGAAHAYDDHSFRLVVEGSRHQTNIMEANELPVMRYDLNVWGKNMRDFISLIKVRYHELTD